MTDNNYFLVKMYFFYLIYCYYDFRMLFDVFIITTFINLIKISNIGFHNNIVYFLLKCFINLFFHVYNQYENYMTNCIKNNTITFNIYILYIKLNNLLLLIINIIYNKTINLLLNKLFFKLNNKKEIKLNTEEIKLNTDEIKLNTEEIKLNTDEIKLNTEEIKLNTEEEIKLNTEEEIKLFLNKLN